VRRGEVKEREVGGLDRGGGLERGGASDQIKEGPRKSQSRKGGREGSE
jgi:hypothetical protein